MNRSMAFLIAFSPFALLGGLLASPSHASIQGVTTSGPGVTLTSVTVNRGGTNFVYPSGDLIGIDVTAFNGNANVILVGAGGAAPAPGSRATLLDGDFRLDTGIINPDPIVTAVGVTFNSPVINSLGTDIVFFEFDFADEGNDGLLISINGSTQTLLPDSGPFAGDFTSRVAVSTLGNVDSLAELERDPFSTANTNNTTQSAWGYSIDLSTFGVAPGASISSFTFGSAPNTATIDPVFIAGLPPVIPEPTSCLIWGLFGLVAMKRRRG